MDATRRGIYLQIIAQALMNIRESGSVSNNEQCVLEAEHVHNIPQFLEQYDERREDYYWTVERRSYLSYSDTYFSSRFDSLWKQLEATPRAMRA